MDSGYCVYCHYCICRGNYRRAAVKQKTADDRNAQVMGFQDF
jgi:hypothetical protein